jgi:hypothetical protein
MFIRNQFSFFNSLPAFPAGKGNSFGTAKAGLGGEVLGLAVGAGKYLTHCSLLIISYSLYVIRYSLLVIRSFN